ncbi:hypothetical protein TKWG_04710 [Advenella kashmirensis WT001]|uniref:Uncharacterized protein n=1 Tax=Advenella kashmirensis (strain DSM 17095 / LMG 22695 / WT001) TaxID=1036672 RepID=I3U8Y0_ADVKW|nr:hypothetical protein TKWG_04710 [Advenella kashmirensis WT001]
MLMGSREAEWISWDIGITNPIDARTAFWQIMQSAIVMKVTCHDCSQAVFPTIFPPARTPACNHWGRLRTV